MKVILQHAGTWLHFSGPEKVLQTGRLDEVGSLLTEAEQSGLFAAGFISYEASPAFDSALQVRPDDSGFPLLCLGLFQAPEVLNGLEEIDDGAYVVGPLAPSVTRDSFIDSIRAIKEAIAAGATYQVNFTYRLQGAFSGDSRAFFRSFVAGQRTEHAAYVELDDWAICSASPELFFRLGGGRLVARPMKGTARRGTTLADDWRAAEALRGSEKDCAENIMIVDMIRNDIGRVATPGSVEVLRLFEVEKYPTCWQMTSTVAGRSASPPSIVLENLFPCASITGAPKAKTMELIRSLETTPRRIYTGSIGFMRSTDEASFNVAIRTALIDRSAGTLEYGVGGGIVWDSDPAAEFEETLTKARVLMEPRPDFRLLETVRWSPDEGLFLRDAHLMRMTRSAAYFDFSFERFKVEQELDAAVGRLEPVPHRVRLLVARDGSVEVQLFPLEEVEERVLTVGISPIPVDSSNPFLYHKTTHRAVYERALSGQPQCDDVILLNERGEVTESCYGNVVAQLDGGWVTPPVACGLLAGTYRDALLKSGEVTERVISENELRGATAVYVVNSVRRWQRCVWAEA
jgi:para-aminobenzoate synthetase / 4-amino-4-deoxychorismate lyase